MSYSTENCRKVEFHQRATLKRLKRNLLFPRIDIFRGIYIDYCVIPIVIDCVSLLL